GRRARSRAARRGCCATVALDRRGCGTPPPATGDGPSARESRRRVEVSSQALLARLESATELFRPWPATCTRSARWPASSGSSGVDHRDGQVLLLWHPEPSYPGHERTGWR